MLRSRLKIQHLEEENKKWHKKDKTGHHHQPAGPVDDNGEEEGGKESPGAGKVVWEGGRCEQESKKDWRQVDELCHQEPDGWIYMCVCVCGLSKLYVYLLISLTVPI